MKKTFGIIRNLDSNGKCTYFQMSDVGITRACVHDIPVKVLPKALWHEFRAPPTHEYSVIFIFFFQMFVKQIENCCQISYRQIPSKSG